MRSLDSFLARDDMSKDSCLKFKNIFPIKKYRIYGNSMFPTLNAGSMVLACRYFFSKPKTGDIIVVRDPRDGKTLIKRVSKIENRQYFVEGDNKTASTDSRNFGMIDKDNIIGKVIFVL